MKYAIALPAPGLHHGDYPERLASAAVGAGRARRGSRPLCSPASVIGRVRGYLATHGDTLGEMPGGELARHRAALIRQRLGDDATLPALAVAVRAASDQLGLSAHDGQIVAAHAIINERLVELATGEGKTLALALAAAAIALGGVPVHVLTANEYLARRDAANAHRLFAALGLTSEAVTESLSPEARRRAYGADVVHVSARTVAFDWLRDQEQRQRGATMPPVLRGLCMGIVDEADCVLLDEAALPLVIANATQSDPPHAVCKALLEWAQSLEPGRDFVAMTDRSGVRLQPSGRAALQRWLDAQVAVAGDKRRAFADLAVQALVAVHLRHRERDYIVRAQRVLIVDPTTARAEPGRRWPHGLHRLVEIKESCPAQPEAVTTRSTTFQTFLSRYHMLAGASGTLREARGELLRTYGLEVVHVPPARPSALVRCPTRGFADHAQLHAAIADRVTTVSRTGQPVLVGVQTVEEADLLGAVLAERGLAPAVLHARNDALEARIVQRAGVAGAITVATGMAGRGTDIVLSEAARRAGGLHVLCAQANPSPRIDRQLVGRSARHGDPGSAEHWFALDHPLFATSVAPPLLAVLAAFARRRMVSGCLARLVLGLAQWTAERNARRARAALVAAERAIDTHTSLLPTSPVPPQ